MTHRAPIAALDRIAAQTLEELSRVGLRRHTRRVEGRAGPYMRVDGREVLMLGGANYLDLAGDPRVIAAARDAAEQSGVAAGGSRLISGNLALHESLEAELARFSGTEAALVFANGYLANLGVITALAGPGDVIVSDALNHASIIDACRLSQAEVRVFAHNDVEDFARVSGTLAGFRRRIMIVDGVYSMDGDLAPLAELVPVARERDIIVAVDDAHGVGVLGAFGRGAAELAGVAPDLVIGNLAKAIGSYGAYVACSPAVRDMLINTARSFIFTCALPPACASAALTALRIIGDEPERRRSLLAGAESLRAALRRSGFDTGRSVAHIVPAIVGGNRRVMELCERALEVGVYAQGIRYPAVPRGAERIRFTPMSSHAALELEAAAEVFARLRDAAGEAE